MTAPIYRRIEETEIAALYKALMDVFDGLDPAVFPKQIMQEARRGYTPESLSKRVFGKQSFAVGAFIGREMVGFAWGWSGREGVFVIDWIGVVQSYRRQGIFTKLLQLIEENVQAMELYKISLYTSATGAAEIDLYARRGYAVEGIHNNHFFGWDFVSLGKIVKRPAWRRADEGSAY
jgi:ribosomal protein S18 acetylase RimI-like enzyme